MLCYTTHINTKENLTKDILINMFIDWIMNSRNNMRDLEYNHSYHFNYEIDSKTLNIEDYEKHHILGLQFITNDNNRNITFIVEVMYDYDHHTLDMNFYCELDNESIYRGIKGIPNIFRIILESNYIKDDKGIKIKNTPHYMGRNEYDYHINTMHLLPIVVLNKNTQLKQYCVIHPNKLAEKLYGIAHVVVINNRKEPGIEIIYPNTYKEKLDIQRETVLQSICYTHIMSYLTRVNKEYYKYDELSDLYLYYKNELRKKDSNDTVDLFKEEINTYEEYLKELKEEYALLKQELLELNNKELELNKNIKNNKEVLLYTSNKDNKEEKEILLKLINKIYNNYPPKAQSRKLPILESIIRSEQ